MVEEDIRLGFCFVGEKRINGLTHGIWFKKDSNIRIKGEGIINLNDDTIVSSCLAHQFVWVTY